MSLQDEMTAVRRRLDDLVRTVERLERDLPGAAGSEPPGAGSEPRSGAPAHAQELVTIPDTPYDSTLWTDSDDEGLGVRDRRAP
ncbi:hypothetical protein [Streptomyces corynorhini]|uniref:Uncharacterized protein n=1 Tax=Streptomyces corynorhini TaxID=2282652 RepID=A0A370BHF1_9ACTN|nr:hypothetical protein [Streptomyces corynorhini]RDG39223.1 hypothetical protein DVH02_04935 [Streptomyces corynorhini]